MLFFSFLPVASSFKYILKRFDCAVCTTLYEELSNVFRAVIIMNISLSGKFFLGPFDITSCRGRLVASGLPLTLDLADCERYCGKVLVHS